MSLRGRLNYQEVADVFRVVGKSKLSGVLNIGWEGHEARFFFVQGKLIRAECSDFSNRLGEILTEAGVLSLAQLEEVLALQRLPEETRRIGTLLSEEFNIDENEIEKALVHQFKQIANTVFKWPGGEFFFQLQTHSIEVDQFQLNPYEFIIKAGLEASLLVCEGLGARGKRAIDEKNGKLSVASNGS